MVILSNLPMNPAQNIQYANLVNIERLQALLESFHQVIGIANAVIDVHGVILAKAGWQRACRDYHRINPETCKLCLESDTALAEKLTEGSHFASYRCLNGLIDTAAPIILEGQHVANLFTGQFFTEKPDLASFRKRAQVFGFNEDDYLKAIEEIPIIPTERIEGITKLYAQLAAMLAENGLDRLHQQRATEQLTALNKDLEARVDQRTKELALGERRLRTVIEVSPVPKGLLAPDGKVLSLNAAFTNCFGYTLQDLPYINDWWFKAYPNPDYRAWAMQTWEHRQKDAERSHTNFEPTKVKIIDKNGNTKIAIVETAQINIDGKMDSQLVVFHDITEMELAHEAQLRSEMKLRTLYDSTSDAIMLLDKNGFIDCNPATLKMFGCSSNEQFYQLHPADLSPELQACGTASKLLAEQHITSAIAHGKNQFEWLHRRVDNQQEFPAEVLLTPMHLDGKSIVQAVVRDISTRKAAEQSLLKERALLRDILDKSPVNIGIAYEQKIQFANKKCIETFGIQPGDSSPALFACQQQREQLLEELNRNGILQNQGVQMRDKDGATRDMRSTFMSISYEGNPGILAWIEDVTEKKAAEKVIAQQRKAMQNLLDLSPVGTAFTTQGIFNYANPAFERMFDVKPGDAALKIYVNPSDRETLMEMLKRDGVISDHEMRLKSAGDEIRDYVLTYIPFIHDQQEGLMSWAIDITERKQAEMALRESKERLEAAAKAGIIGVWDWNIRTNHLIWDKVMYQLYGVQEDAFETAYDAWSSTIHPDDRDFINQEIQAALKGEHEYAPEFRVIWPDGSIHFLKAISQVTFDRSGKPIRMLGVNYDLTEQKQVQAQLDKMAYYDRLTKLPNRRLLEDRLEHALTQAKRERHKLALLFIDLDKFKQVNDEQGHDAGDWLLNQVASRILQCIRESDTASRIGGDEFIILLPNVTASADACQVAEKIRVKLAENFTMDDERVLDISSSIGVAMYPDHADSARELMKFGDEAMYQAKKSGRNSVVLFETPQTDNESTNQTGDSLVRLRWTPNFISGSDIIDQEHRELLIRSNALLDLSASPDTSRDDFNQAFYALLQFIEHHFADEEKILRDHHYPELIEHLQMHQTLLTQAHQLYQQSLRADLSASQLIEFFATEVVGNHLLREDKKFFGLLSSTKS